MKIFFSDCNNDGNVKKKAKEIKIEELNEKKNI